MNHFKDFLIKLHTIDIKTSERKKVINGELGQIKFYDISHQNPSLNNAFKNELKELKELAITDLLNLPREQVFFQLQRLIDVKECFEKFRYNLYHLHADRRTEPLEYFYSLHLDDIFITPRLYFADHAIADENLIEDLIDSLRARQDMLKEFEEGVSKAIDLPEESETVANIEAPKKVAKAGPVFKEEIIHEFFAIIKSYFSAADRVCC